VTELLRTERLILRELEERDLEPLAAILGDPDTMRYYPRPFTREEVRAWIDRNRASYVAEGFGLYALEDRADGGLVGECGLSLKIVEGLPEVEIGWHVLRTRWRRGLGTEAAAVVLGHAFGPLGLRRVVALVRPENQPSAALARKVGMSVERDVDYKGIHHHLFARQRPGA
jgi:RimJ/RimL family protein N-acetyltransferase